MSRSRENPAGQRVYGAAIPLARSAPLDVEHLHDQLKAVATAAGARVKLLESSAPGKGGLLASLRGASGSARIQIAGFDLTITLTPKPLCPPKSMHQFINPALWKQGIAGMTGHKAHLLVAETDVSTAGTSRNAMFDRATAVTLAAAAAADVPGAQGVIWMPARNSLPVSAFGSEMERFMDGQAPLLFWVRSQTLPAPVRQDVELETGETMEPGVATVGLTAFIGAEIIAPPSYCDRDVALDYAFALASAVIDENRELKDGALMGHGRDRMRLAMKKSGPYSERPYWELQSVYEPEVKLVRRAPATQAPLPPVASDTAHLVPPRPAPQARQPMPPAPPVAPPPAAPSAPPQAAAARPGQGERPRPSTWRRSAPAEPVAQPPAATQPPAAPPPAAHSPAPPPQLPPDHGLGPNLTGPLPKFGGALVDPDEVLKAAMSSSDPLDALPAALRPARQFTEPPPEYGVTPQARPPAPPQHGTPQAPADPMDELPAALRPEPARPGHPPAPPLVQEPAQSQAQKTAQNQAQPKSAQPHSGGISPEALLGQPTARAQRRYGETPEPAPEPKRAAKRKAPRRMPPPEAESGSLGTDIPRPTAEERFDETPPEPEDLAEGQDPRDDGGGDDGDGGGDDAPFFDKHLRLVVPGRR